MQRPWIQFHTRDWLDNKELRRCSPVARSVLADLMCLANEGVPHGYLTDRVGPLTEEYMASRCFVPIAKFRAAVLELKQAGRLSVSEQQVMFVPRMVRDEEIRLARAAGGTLSKGNPLLRGQGRGSVNGKGYPSPLPSESDERIRGPRVRTDVCSDSGSDSGDLAPEGSAEGNPLYERYHDLVASWPNPTEIDYGSQVWIAYCDDGTIDSERIHEIFEGLERFKVSKVWAKGYKQSIAKWLIGKRWKDHPERAEPKGDW